MNRSSVVWLSILMILSSPWAHANETTIQREALPAAVRDSLNSRYPGAKLLHLMREGEKNATLYEAEMSLPGGRIDALFDSDGRLREEEARIPASALPEAVRSAAQRVLGGRGSVVRIERLTSWAKQQGVRFEMLVSRRGKRTEYVYTAGGRLLETRRDTKGD